MDSSIAPSAYVKVDQAPIATVSSEVTTDSSSKGLTFFAWVSVITEQTDVRVTHKLLGYQCSMEPLTWDFFPGARRMRTPLKVCMYVEVV
jgi:hypothetical protein